MWLGIYIIIIGWSVCRQLCDWSAHNMGLACAQRRPICAGRARARMCGQDPRVIQGLYLIKIRLMSSSIAGRGPTTMFCSLCRGPKFVVMPLILSCIPTLAVHLITTWPRPLTCWPQDQCTLSTGVGSSSCFSVTARSDTHTQSLITQPMHRLLAAW